MAEAERIAALALLTSPEAVSHRQLKVGTAADA